MILYSVLRKRRYRELSPRRVAAKLSSLVENLDNTLAVMKICTELGQAHKMYNVKPEYFDVSNILSLSSYSFSVRFTIHVFPISSLF